MSTGKKVALVGWEPDVVDYSRWPGVTAAQVRAGLEASRDRLIALGYDAELVYITSGDTAYDTVRSILKETQYDCIMIGAGVRRDDAQFFVFEQLVNAVHAGAPQAKICFNTNPEDTAEAVQRWL